MFDNFSDVSNFDLINIITLVNEVKLQELLIEANYDKKQTDYLVKGFSQGFDLEYWGPDPHRDLSQNLTLHVGDKTMLWTKVMKEVKQNRYAEPFSKIPLNKYVLSPIGLVPKDGGKDMRLIFHLSYDFLKSGNKSVNYYMSKEVSSVKYKDLDHTIQQSLQLLRNIQFDIEDDENMYIWYGNSDIKSAFHLVSF